MDIRTIQDRVVVEVEFKDEESSSGIYLGEGEATNEGIVVEVGPGKEHEMSIKVGDRVVIDPSTGHKIKVGGRKFLVVRESEIFAVLED